MNTTNTNTAQDPHYTATIQLQSGRVAGQGSARTRSNAEYFAIQDALASDDSRDQTAGRFQARIFPGDHKWHTHTGETITTDDCQ